MYDGLFKDWFKQRRKFLDLTQKELAEQVHCSLGTIHGIEQGVQRPSRQLAELLAVALQVPPSERDAFVRWARSAVSSHTIARLPGDLPTGTAPFVSLAEANDDTRPTLQARRIESFTVYSVQDWGEAPAVDTFLGRQAELDRLCEWLVVDRCKLIGVLGIGGIGKTALATYASTHVQQQFSVVIWRSLRNAPPLAELLGQCIAVLANQGEYQLAAPVEQRLELLFEYLRSQRCLLVLDNFESILQHEVSGTYLRGFEGYGELVKRFGEGRHQSCLLLTSREKPEELVQLAGTTGPVRELVLFSLSAVDCHALLHDRGLHGSAEAWAALHSRYSGNPLALQIVSETIRELFDGEIGSFLAQETPLVGGIAGLLGQQFARLSPLEQEILFWLAVEREPVTISELLADLGHSFNRKAVFESVHTLRQRSLVERVQQTFTLQNVVLEYITATLVDRICEEISSTTAVMLQRYALLKATAKSYVRESQRNLILGPIAQRLADEPGPNTAEDRLASLLAYLRRTSHHQHGYAAGSVLNLMAHLGIDLRGHDFSQLAVWQADLRNVTAQDVDFQGADLAQSAFRDTFGGIGAIAFSPDGRRLAAGTTSGEIRIWSGDNGIPLLSWPAHSGWVAAAAFSPDGLVLASGGRDRSVRLWSTVDGRHLQTLLGHTDQVTSISFSPDGSVLASSSLDQTIRLWDSQTGKCIHALAGNAGSVLGACFRSDGKVLASACRDNVVQLWNPQNGMCEQVLQEHTDWVGCVCFSPDGQRLATASGDMDIRLWDPHTGECLQVMPAYTDNPLSLCFSPDGRLLACSNSDMNVKIYDADTGRCLHTLYGYGGSVVSTHFHPDGNVLATGSTDQTVRLWDPHTGQCLQTLYGYADWLISVCFSPDGSLLASGGLHQAVRLWDSHTGACQLTLYGHTSWVWCVCFSPNSSIVASGCGDATVRLWDRHTGTCLRILEVHATDVMSVCFSPDGSVLATASMDNKVRLWDPHTGRCLQVLAEHTAGVRSVCFSPDGSLLASGSSDETVRLWDSHTGVCLRTLHGHTASIFSVCFSPDGNYMASACLDQTLRLWDSRSGQCLQVFEGHSGWIFSVCFSPDGSLLASAGGDQTVRLWDVLSGRELTKLQGHTNDVMSVCFSPNGEVVASSSSDETIKLWAVNDLSCRHTLRAERPYARMNIAGATGLTPAQADTLKRLGAMD